ncbi:hypothetical protein [Aromatoleum toluclasticum]|uniref:hypothetical protein n=1 Tax=Aromatoleum toluclasticum TaxID=92003 RepID=UPI000476DD0B|nr:hypothetical protein [Aromatoleum toluclasticum]
MGRLAELLASGKRVLWVEATAYAERLLADGTVAWLDAAEVVAWHRKAQGLLKSDVVALPVEPIAEAWLAHDEDLVEAMGTKKRAVAPLKTLLATDALRDHIGEILRGLRASYRNAPLALVLPSPRRWVAEAYLAAHGETVDVGDELADDAAMYVADFVRSFGDTELDVLLLEESDAPTTTGALEAYRSVLNLAAHYRWECGLRSPGPLDVSADGLAFCIAPKSADALPTGLAVSLAFWSGEAAPEVPPGGFRFVEIPADAVPETTLERLATLR